MQFDEAAKPKQASSLVDKIRNQIGDPRFCDFTLVITFMDLTYR